MIDMDPRKTYTFKIEGNIRLINDILGLSVGSYIDSYELIEWPRDISPLDRLADLDEELGLQ